MAVRTVVREEGVGLIVSGMDQQGLEFNVIIIMRAGIVAPEKLAHVACQLGPGRARLCPVCERPPNGTGKWDALSY